jgi:hypothetical protein
MPKDFFAALLDVSFDSLITTKIVKLVYVLFMVLVGLTVLVFVIAAFETSSAVGVIVLLIGAPLVSLIYLVFVRVFLEAVIALFRIMENTQELVVRGLGAPGPGSPIAPGGLPGPSGVPPSPPAA